MKKWKITEYDEDGRILCVMRGYVSQEKAEQAVEEFEKEDKLPCNRLFSYHHFYVVEEDNDLVFESED